MALWKVFIQIDNSVLEETVLIEFNLNHSVHDYFVTRTYLKLLSTFAHNPGSNGLC